MNWSRRSLVALALAIASAAPAAAALPLSKLKFDAVHHEDPGVRKALAALLEASYFPPAGEPYGAPDAKPPPRPPEQAPIDLQRLIQVATPVARARSPGVGVEPVRAYRDPRGKKPAHVWTVRFKNPKGRVGVKVYVDVDVRTWEVLD